jgi:hypothetical protein
MRSLHVQPYAVLFMPLACLLPGCEMLCLVDGGYS